MSQFKTITCGGITLHSYVNGDDKKNPFRVLVDAMLPKEFVKDWEGTSIYLLDWKIDGNTAWIRYQLKNDAYASINELTLPVETHNFPMKAPNKSKHWEFDHYTDQWKNRKTGQKTFAI